MSLIYTNIQHDFRKRNGLSCNEYVLCDMIFFLSSKETSNVPGWCYMSRNVMADDIGLSKQGLLNMIDRLIDEGLLIRNEQTKFLKTSEKWQVVYFTDGKQSLPLDGKQTILEGGKQTLPNNNTINNNKEDKKDNPAQKLEKIKKRKDKFFADLLEWKSKNTDKYPAKMLQAFFDYWSEVNKNGSKMRYDAQDYFDINRRLITWRKNTTDAEINLQWKSHWELVQKKTTDLFTTSKT